MNKTDFLIVGSGLFGPVIAERIAIISTEIFGGTLALILSKNKLYKINLYKKNYWYKM